jgi:hypothetical protein
LAGRRNAASAPWVLVTERLTAIAVIGDHM